VFPSVHADPHKVLYTLDRPVSQLPSNQCIFAREPTSHFQVEVLAPLQSPQAPMLVLKSAHAYVTGLFSHLGVHDAASLYSAAFFTAANLHLFLAVDTWNMSATSRAGDESFTVYHFLRCLPEFANETPLLPATGLNLLQAKHFACFVQTWFRLMDMKPGSTAACRFDHSQLGCRIAKWVSLLDSRQVHSLWDSHPAVLTYQWFGVLRSLLAIFAEWIIRELTRPG
jgi:hypothetical protein